MSTCVNLCKPTIIIIYYILYNYLIYNYLYLIYKYIISLFRLTFGLHLVDIWFTHKFKI